MDEMDEYRARIDRRYGDRRLKNDRRRYPRRPTPKMFEKELLWLLAGIAGIAAYFRITN